MKVFVSSLISGMAAERAAAKHAIELFRHQPIMAEDFGARASSPQVACLQGIREADVVVLIIGAHYGSRQDSGLSATHEEVREARGAKHILMFVPAGEVEHAEQEIIDEVSGWESGQFWKRYSDARDLGDQIARALHDFELAHAVAPLDPEALRARAQALLPPVERHTAGALLSLAVAVGPPQAVLRPSKIEDEQLAAALHQQALFGDPPVFDRTAGVEVEFDEGALVIRQNARNGAGARIALWETGDLLIQVPPGGPAAGRETGLPALIDEEIEQRLAAAIGYAAWVLGRIDPTQKLTHVALAARISGASSYFAWRTRAEHARSPNSGSMAGFGREDRRENPVLLTPALRARAALTMDATLLVEDLLTLLRRAWKD